MLSMFRPPHQIDFYNYRPRGLKLLKEAFIEKREDAQRT